jgi:hypothetical protein
VKMKKKGLRGCGERREKKMKHKKGKTIVVLSPFSRFHSTRWVLWDWCACLIDFLGCSSKCGQTGDVTKQGRSNKYSNPPNRPRQTTTFSRCEHNNTNKKSDFLGGWCFATHPNDQSLNNKNSCKENSTCSTSLTYTAHCIHPADELS